MRTAVLFVFLLSIPICVFSQKNKKEEENIDLRTTVNQWYEGSILTTKDEELKGLVKYDDRNAVLSFKAGDLQRSFAPRSVTAFEFFDESVQKQRVFYSLEAMDPQTDMKRFAFFEIIRDFNDFAVLLKIEPLEVKQKTSTWATVYPNATNGSPAYQQGRTSPVFYQDESIFFLRPSGELTRYLTVTTIDDDRLFSLGKTTSSDLEEDVLAEFVSEPVYEQLKAYAKENGLKFKRKADFIKILEYYSTLRGTK